MFPVAETEFPTGIRPGGMGIPELPPAVKEVWSVDACVLTSDYYAVAALLLAGCETGTLKNIHVRLKILSGQIYLQSISFHLLRYHVLTFFFIVVFFL